MKKNTNNSKKRLFEMMNKVAGMSLNEEAHNNGKDQYGLSKSDYIDFFKIAFNDEVINQIKSKMITPDGHIDEFVIMNILKNILHKRNTNDNVSKKYHEVNSYNNKFRADHINIDDYDYDFIEKLQEEALDYLSKVMGIELFW